MYFRRYKRGCDVNNTKPYDQHFVVKIQLIQSDVRLKKLLDKSESGLYFF